MFYIPTLVIFSMKHIFFYMKTFSKSFSTYIVPKALKIFPFHEMAEISSLKQKLKTIKTLFY